MTLIRWTPFKDVLGLQDEMNRLFNTYFARSSEKEGPSYLWHPVVDISETEEEIKVTAELPGVDKANVKISLQDNVLTLQGEKRQEEEEKAKNYHRVERTYGTFQRSFSLSASVKTDEVKANYKDGVLIITLPKSEEAKPREIDISVK